MPELDRYAETNSDKLVIIGVDAWEDRRKVERFVSKFGVGFPVGIDNGSIFESYQTTSNVRRDLRQLSGSGEASHRR